MGIKLLIYKYNHITMNILPNDLITKILDILKIQNNNEKYLESKIQNLLYLINITGNTIDVCNKCKKYSFIEDYDNELNISNKDIVYKCNKCLCFYHTHCINMYINDDENICIKCKLSTEI